MFRIKRHHISLYGLYGLLILAKSLDWQRQAILECLVAGTGLSRIAVGDGSGGGYFTNFLMSFSLASLSKKPFCQFTFG